jgi:hypothetical protein
MTMTRSHALCALALFVLLLPAFAQAQRVPFSYWKSRGAVAKRQAVPDSQRVIAARPGQAAAANAADITAFLTVGRPYPSPVGPASASGATSMSIPVNVGREARVVMELNDIMMRHVADLYDGVVQAGWTDIPVILPASLPAAPYLVIVKAGGSAAAVRVSWVR